MSGPALWAFFITCVGLVIIVVLIFTAIEMVQAPDGFKRIARFAVGGAALLIFLVAVGGALGMGGAGMVRVTPASVIEFAIGLVVLLAILYLATIIIGYFGVFVTEINYVIAAIAIIVILILALRAITGGMGIVPPNLLGGGQRSESQFPAIGATMPPQQNIMINEPRSWVWTSN